jgi:ABC-2 type transport system permease protein
MRNFFAIWSRELASCFLSPVAYVTMVIFLAVTGATFFSLLILGSGTNTTVCGILFETITFWVTILITVVSMRLFAEERRIGTLEPLMTAPVTELQVVLGKYFGALFFLIIVLAPTVSFVFLADWLSPGIDRIDFGALQGGCLIVLLFSAFCVALGELVSLLCRNQISSALGCLTAVWFVILFGPLVSGLPFGIGGIGEYVSAMRHLDEFTAGTIDTRPIVLYLSGTWLVLFICVRALESRRWR